MNIELEKFSLSHLGAQFREFNFAVRDNAHRLTPHFWWARAGKMKRFNFILSGLVAEKIAGLAHDLPYNKKFIIRIDGKFSGVIGLDGVAQNAPRAEVWCFVTNEGKHIATRALEKIEDFAQTKSVQSIYAKIALDNHQAARSIARAGYTSSLQNAQFATWHKNLNDKTY